MDPVSPKFSTFFVKSIDGYTIVKGTETSENCSVNKNPEKALMEGRGERVGILDCHSVLDGSYAAA